MTRRETGPRGLVEAVVQPDVFVQCMPILNSGYYSPRGERTVQVDNSFDSPASQPRTCRTTELERRSLVVPSPDHRQRRWYHHRIHHKAAEREPYARCRSAPRPPWRNAERYQQGDRLRRLGLFPRSIRKDEGGGVQAELRGVRSDLLDIDILTAPSAASSGTASSTTSSDEDLAVRERGPCSSLPLFLRRATLVYG